ncbi:DUF1795 domain-containing protein [Paracoccus sp. M683]|uniref:DcrB-related protein n=1 Tax=Paracoccus sp. M683 TaxID=2594268 RepID=UPI001181482C|nr:DUF1795 domain-containing protein [Paracoccus sp. M683]TRW95911.1 DUF1795 domain-containing protein [Paracoccus sp. M683]
MYRLNEGMIDLPGDWHDRSINVVSSNLTGSGASFTITRDEMPWGMGFGEYVDDQGKQAAQALKDFKIHDRRELKVSDAPAVEMECSWVSKAGKMHQIITTVQGEGQKVLILTASVGGAMSENQKAEMRRIVSTLRLERGKG